jgi:hypothetical protein
MQIQQNPENLRSQDNGSEVLPFFFVFLSQITPLTAKNLYQFHQSHRDFNRRP